MVDTVLELAVRSVTPLAPDATIAIARPDSIPSASPIADRYVSLLALSASYLREHATRELLAEAALSPDERRRAAHRRLAAWLDLDDEAARVLARAYDEAARALDPAALTAWVEAERDAILHGLSFRQFTRIAEMIPRLRSRLGLEVMASAVHRARHASTEGAPA